MNDINDIYVFVYDGEIPLSKALTDEVTKAEWMAREEIVSLWQSGKTCLGDQCRYNFRNNAQFTICS